MVFGGKELVFVLAALGAFGMREGSGRKTRNDQFAITGVTEVLRWSC